MIVMAAGAQLIKRARLSAGLTQAELARRASTSQSAIAAYEAGTKTPTVDTLARLLAATGRRLTDIAIPTRKGGKLLVHLLRDRRDSIIATAAAHRASNVRVFGSVARGRAREGSDIDLLVDMESGASLLDQVRLRRALRELLGVDVDVVTSRGLLERDSPILDEAVPL
jgi:predicted nucleotidyltransferase/DNA-binding XRE family transcriptional regulator